MKIISGKLPLIIFLGVSLPSGMILTQCNSSPRLKIATTTSLADTGLLDILISSFTQRSKIKINVIAVGSGKAFALAKRGDVDMVLVHDKESEIKFVALGYGKNRQEIMFNDFLLVGPKLDPVKIKDLKVIDAFIKLAKYKKKFVSRADESGTHQKEKNLWRLAKSVPQGKWYIQTGQGMGTTLLIASEKQAYCLTDRGTYLAFKNKIDLVPLCQGDKTLLNCYSAILTYSRRFPKINTVAATKFVRYITSPDGQQIINVFNINGEQIFYSVNPTSLN